MNRNHLFAAGAATLVGLSILAAWGPLDPPNGPIAPTYKTLTQIEPRIEVNAQNTPGDATSLYKISKPGSYYLTGNITGVQGKDGILIASSRVTLDLNGFSLEGVDGALDGVEVNADNGISVRNGAAYNWKVGFNILETNGGRVSNLSAAYNFNYGIEIGPAGVATDCTAQRSSGPNFYIFSFATVTRCTSRYGSGRGFDLETNCVLTECTSSGDASGFYAAGPAVLNNCTATDGNSFGFHLEESAVLTDCNANNNGSSGFLASARCRMTRCHARKNLEGFYINEGNALIECTGDSHSGDGVRIIGNANTIERCTFHENGASGINLNNGNGNSIDGNLCTYNKLYGIYAADTDNLAVRNRCRGNTQGNYSLISGNDYGLILTNPGQGFSSSAAWANFAY